MQKTVFSFGEILWDVLPSATILGGAPFNFAARINMLGDKGLMISRIGKDELGEKAFQKVKELGLDPSFLQWDEKYPTGTVDVSFDANKNPDYIINPNVAYDFVGFNKTLEEFVAKADCLCFGTLAQRSQKSRQTLNQLVEIASNAVLFLDINLRKLCYSSETIAYSLQKANVLKLNEDEAAYLIQLYQFKTDSIPEFCNWMIEKWTLDYCLVTLGEKGAFAQSANGDSIYLPGYKINLVDPLGSGDAFSAGFVHKLLSGSTMQQACDFGNLIGAIVATQNGGTQPVTEDLIITFKDNHITRVVDDRLENYTKL